MDLRSTFARKTFKRELAVIALGLWAAVTVKVFWHMPPEAVCALDGYYGTLSTSVWLFAAAAFGLDSIAKQMSIVAAPGGGRRAGHDPIPCRPTPEPTS